MKKSLILALFCIVLVSPRALAKTTGILFIGDSLTSGYGVPKEKNYPSLLFKKFEEEGIKVAIINGAISGSTTASGLSRYNFYQKSNPKTEIVVLALGANDGLRGINSRVTYNNLKNLIVRIQADGKEILLAGMKTPPNYGKAFAKGFEKVFFDLAKQYSLKMIPFLLEGVASKKEYNQSDGIHPNEKGYVIIAETVYKHLRPMVIKKQK